jgi:hypothetical protein
MTSISSPWSLNVAGDDSKLVVGLPRILREPVDEKPKVGRWKWELASE